MTILKNLETINYQLLQKYIREESEPVVVTLYHTGLMINIYPPYLESILQSGVVTKLLLTMKTNCGAAIPIKMGIVKGKRKHRVFLSTGPLFMSGGKPLARYRTELCELELREDIIKAKPTDKKLQVGREVVRGAFYDSIQIISMVSGKEIKSIKIGGTSFTVNIARGGFRNEFNYYITVYNPLAYIALGFPGYIEPFIPDGIGFKRSAAVLDVVVDRLSTKVEPWYPLIAELPDGNYVLLKHLPVDVFREEDIVFPIPNMLRTIPPYYNVKNRVEVLMPGSIVSSIPEVSYIKR